MIFGIKEGDIFKSTSGRLVIINYIGPDGGFIVSITFGLGYRTFIINDIDTSWIKLKM